MDDVETTQPAAGDLLAICPKCDRAMGEHDGTKCPKPSKRTPPRRQLGDPAVPVLTAPPAPGPADPGRYEPALPTGQIVPSPFNRKVKRTRPLDELADSIRTHGVINPITVRPIETLAGIASHELVAGERRWRASELAGRDTIPAIVRVLTDDQVVEIQLIENLHREDLHPIEEADTYAELLKLPGYTEDRIADRTGQKVSHVRERLRLTRLTPAVRELFIAGKLGLEVALLIGRMPAIAELQDKAAAEIAKGAEHGAWNGNKREDWRPLTIREARDHLRSNYMLQLERATWKLDDAELVPTAGACSTCPKRTGNQPTLFADVKEADTCIDPVCFRAKTDAQYKRAAAAAKDRGLKVLADKDAKQLFGQGVDHRRGVTEVKSDAKLVDLGGSLPYSVPGGGYDSKKTWSTLLKGVPNAPPIVIAKDPATGAVRELVDRDAALKAAKAAGKLKPERSAPKADPTAAKKEREQRAKEKQREAIERAGFDRVLGAIAIGKAPRIERTLWRWLGQALAEQLGEGEEVVLVRRGYLEERPGTHKDPTKDLAKWFDKATVEELRGFALEVLAAQFGVWDRDHARVEELCAILGIDRKAHLEAARKSVEAEAQVAAVAKVKPAAKGKGGRRG